MWGKLSIGEPHGAEWGACPSQEGLPQAFRMVGEDLDH